jgi:GAF domain-containing protein/HAMP domain-containing protein
MDEVTRTMKTVTVKPKTRSLTTTLAISFFSLSALVLLISSSLQILLSIQAQQAEIKERQQLIAQDAGKSVSSFIERRFNTMETAAEFSNLATASYQERITALQGMLGIDPAFKQINMLNSGAFQQAFVSRTSQTATSQFTSQITGSIYAAMSMGERFVISPIYFDENTSEPLITLGLPYKTVVGDYQGILATEVSLKFIWDLVDQIKVGETGYVYVVDNRGNLIAYKDTSRVLQGENVSQISEVSEFLIDPAASADQTPEIQTYVGLNGETVLGTYIPLGTPQWAVVIELPWKEAYQNIISLAWQSLALILIIALLAGLVGYLGARRTSAPLVDLSNVAIEIANGNLSAQARETGVSELVQLSNSFNNMTSQLRDSIGNLEQRVFQRTQALAVANQQSERRAKQFEAIAQVARSITSTQNFEILLPQITNLLSREFGFYHVGIFLLDARKEYAVLSASNSEGGQRMLERNHRLKVGETGLVGFVTSAGKARVALDTGADAMFFNNPDLPETRSEIALPLLVGNQIIGALDVQSNQPNAFDQDDINILSTLADQVSIAIQNARQYEATRRALSESESLSRQFVQTGWQQFTKSQNLTGIRHTGAKATLLYAKSRKGKGEDESSSNREQARAKARGATLSLPVKLRGEVIGSVDVRSPANRQFDQDELDIVTAIIERAAIAMENARLLAESQKRAAKERTIGEISTKISAQSDVDELLKTAVQELGRTLPGTEISVQLRKEEAE